ncbi:MAG: hypothetical protein J1E85_01720 [Ruminococcus sp.]|nr:hypothetical protein [Ruminococcus sp.]
MKCQNCGFESADKICSVCGAEIDEKQAQALQNSENTDISISDEQTHETSKQKPKKRIRKILLTVLIIILSVAIVSASSITIFYFITNDSRTSFSKVNKTVNCGDFSITLKEVKTPEFLIENYYPQIVYYMVFEFHNNTSQTLNLNRPEITGMITCKGIDSGYMYYNNDYYNLNGKKNYKISFEIPAWSSVEFIERVYYEDYTDEVLSFVSSPSSIFDVVGTDESSTGNSSSESNADDEDEYEIEDDIIIDRSEIKYKKEGLQKYKENSPESFYMILSEKKFGSDEEAQYARFLVEPDKEAIVIPEGDNIE